MITLDKQDLYSVFEKDIVEGTKLKNILRKVLINNPYKFTISYNILNKDFENQFYRYSMYNFFRFNYTVDDDKFILNKNNFEEYLESVFNQAKEYYIEIIKEYNSIILSGGELIENTDFMRFLRDDRNLINLSELRTDEVIKLVKDEEIFKDVNITFLGDSLFEGFDSYDFIHFKFEEYKHTVNKEYMIESYVKNFSSIIKPEDVVGGYKKSHFNKLFDLCGDTDRAAKEIVNILKPINKIVLINEHKIKCDFSEVDYIIDYNDYSIKNNTDLLFECKSVIFNDVILFLEICETFNKLAYKKIDNFYISKENRIKAENILNSYLDVASADWDIANINHKINILKLVKDL